MAGFTMTEREMAEEERAAWRQQHPPGGSIVAGLLVGFAAALLGGMLGFMVGVVLALLLRLSPDEAARLVLACVVGCALVSAGHAGAVQWQVAKTTRLRRQQPRVVAVQGAVQSGVIAGFEESAEPTLILDSGQGELLLLNGGIGLFELVARREFPHTSFELLLADDGELISYRGTGDPVPLLHQPPEALEGCDLHGDGAFVAWSFPGRLATWPDDLRAELDRRAAAR